jgi:hypothetical protein
MLTKYHNKAGAYKISEIVVTVEIRCRGKRKDGRDCNALLAKIDVAELKGCAVKCASCNYMNYF